METGPNPPEPPRRPPLVPPTPAAGAERAATSRGPGRGRRVSPLGALSLAALGVVYGDIGTSPLYALRECFTGPHGVAPTPDNVLGVLSLVVWSLTLVVSLKYVGVMMRADNRGEGGILALLAQVGLERRPRSAAGRALLPLGLFGAALLYGDGMITPAISVLSAVEGLATSAALRPWILWITTAILVGLFAVQRSGSTRVGRVFGPVMLAWFVALGLLGARSLAARPEVLAALDPRHAAAFFARDGWHSFGVLGAVFLVVTGAEALYADMGHFGRRPIRLMWLAVAMPALLLNYFGQGALLLADPGQAGNSFYGLAPGWAHYPLVALATLATVIASQALISAAFSLTRQAVQLGYCPRLVVVHTSSHEIGQIFVPRVNAALAVASIGLVWGFGSSSSLAAAYGLAVALTMTITTLLLFALTRSSWAWPVWRSVALCATLLAVELAFLAANLLKFLRGGWFPLLVGAGVFTLLTTWKRGREILAERLRHVALPLGIFLRDLEAREVQRVPGVAVFLSATREGVPHALLHNLKHNKVLHAQNVLLSVVVEEVPHVPLSERLEIEPLEQGFVQFTGRYGFMEDPNVPDLLDLARTRGYAFRLNQTTFFLGRETLIASSRRRGMAIWREKLFAAMALNARDAGAYFRLPPNRVVELGTQVEL